MNKVICGITMSVDGFVAGSNMTEEKPFGDIPPILLHRWQIEEPEKHTEEIHQLSKVAGAYIMGRNMFGPSGEAYDKSWKGWWGEEPPYHAPVFVLTHRPRTPIAMKGGTTFYFVTEGIAAAMEQAQKAAGDKPVAIAGGANTVNQFLAAGMIDEMWLHIAPCIVSSGARLFENVPRLEMELLSSEGTGLATLVKYRFPKS
jgi:dihydrofolate reductase